MGDFLGPSIFSDRFERDRLGRHATFSDLVYRAFLLLESNIIAGKREACHRPGGE